MRLGFATQLAFGWRFEFSVRNILKSWFVTERNKSQKFLQCDMP